MKRIKKYIKLIYNYVGLLVIKKSKLFNNIRNFTNHVNSCTIFFTNHFRNIKLLLSYLVRGIMIKIIIYKPHRWCLHLTVLVRFESLYDPESYAGSSVTTSRAIQAGQVKGERTNEERHPGPPGLGIEAMD